MRYFLFFFSSLMLFGQVKQVAPDIKLTGTFDASTTTASSTARIGTSLPGTCTVGQVFIKTDATAANQVYVCTATNTWTAQGGGGGASVTVGLISAIPGTCTNGDLYYASDVGINETTRFRICRSNTFRQQAPTAGPSGTIAIDCTGDPCVFDTTSNVPTIGNDQTITSLWSFTGGLLVKNGTAAPSSTDCDASGEAGGIYVQTNASTSRKVFVCTGAGGWEQQIGVAFALNGTATLGTSAISSGTCATVVTVTATGTATTDIVTSSFNGDPTAVTGYSPSTSGMLAIVAYPTSNNVNFKVCNNTASSITPGAITLNWRVSR